MPIFGQVWLWSSLAFLLGALLCWALVALPGPPAGGLSSRPSSRTASAARTGGRPSRASRGVGGPGERPVERPVRTPRPIAAPSRRAERRAERARRAAPPHAPGARGARVVGSGGFLLTRLDPRLPTLPRETDRQRPGPAPPASRAGACGPAPSPGSAATSTPSAEDPATLGGPAGLVRPRRPVRDRARRTAHPAGPPRLVRRRAGRRPAAGGDQPVGRRDGQYPEVDRRLVDDDAEAPAEPPASSSPSTPGPSRTS